MSDLISRSQLLKEIETWGGCVDALHDYIQNMSTAYDVDKVVKELEADSSVKLYGSGNSDNYLVSVKRAIEIVKQGGVADDVCEWNQRKGGVGLKAYNISCCDKTLEMPVSTARGLKYCPYCGKKIKVVE